MARIERVTVTCDGPCGGTLIEGSPFSIKVQPEGLQPRNLDLCGDCSETFLTTYHNGAPAPTKRGRPRKAPSVKATTVPVVSPARDTEDVPIGEGAPHVEPEPVALAVVPGTFHPAQPTGFTINDDNL